MIWGYHHFGKPPYVTSNSNFLGFPVTCPWWELIALGIVSSPHLQLPSLALLLGGQLNWWCWGFFSATPRFYPYIYPLVICYIAIEAMAIEIVKTWLEMVIFHSYVNVYQRVYITALDCGAKLTLTLESFFSFPCFNMLRNIALDERPEVDPIFYIILSYSIYICVPLTNV